MGDKWSQSVEFGEAEQREMNIGTTAAAGLPRDPRETAPRPRAYLSPSKALLRLTAPVLEHEYEVCDTLLGCSSSRSQPAALLVADIVAADIFPAK